VRSSGEATQALPEDPEVLRALLLAACSAPRTYTRATPYPLPDAFACAEEQLRDMDYTIVLADTAQALLDNPQMRQAYLGEI
jgi:hypothetical protein